MVHLTTSIDNETSPSLRIALQFPITNVSSGKFYDYLLSHPRIVPIWHEYTRTTFLLRLLTLFQQTTPS